MPGAGSGSPYGAVPGAIGVPPSIFSQVNTAVPGASNLAAGAAGNIASEQAGVLSPGTQNLLTNKAAALGVNQGQPGGLPGNTISNENLLGQMGLTSEQLSSQGDQNYLSFLGGVGNAQLSPNLLTDIASNNATLAAAPNPTAAASQQQQLMQQYFDMLHGSFNYGTGIHGSGANKTPTNGVTITPPGGQLPTGGYAPLTLGGVA